MKEKPSQINPPVSLPSNLPRIDRVSRTRKVIYANFKANRTEVDFCNRFKAESLAEAVQNPDAALDFLSSVDLFRSNDPTYLVEPIKIAVGTGGSRARFFVEHFHWFAEILRQDALASILYLALDIEKTAAHYFITHMERYEHLPYLGKMKFRQALAIARDRMRR